MIISDLEHLEVAAEETSIVGSGGKWEKKYYKESADAFAKAGANAIGKVTQSYTYTSANAVQGVFASSESVSAASASKY